MKLRKRILLSCQYIKWKC